MLCNSGGAQPPTLDPIQDEAQGAAETPALQPGPQTCPQRTSLQCLGWLGQGGCVLGVCGEDAWLAVLSGHGCGCVYTGLAGVDVHLHMCMALLSVYACAWVCLVYMPTHG